MSRIAVIVAIVASVAWAPFAFALAPMRVQPRKGDKVEYQVDVKLGSDTTSETRTGRIVYEITEATADGFTLQQTGTLARKVTKSEFQNLTDSIQRLSIFRPTWDADTPQFTRFDPSGRALSWQGLPGPPTAVGFVPDMIVEPLSPQGSTPWTFTRRSAVEYVAPHVNAAATTRYKTRQYLTHHYPCEETFTYTVVSQSPKGIVVDKSYECLTLDTVGGEPHVRITAKGRITLDPATNLAIEGTLTGEAACATDLALIRVPFTVSYQRLSAAELATIEADRAKEKADAAARMDRLQNLRTPLGKELTAAEMTNALRDLKSPDLAKRGDALEKFARATPTAARAADVLAAVRAVPRDTEDKFINYARAAAEDNWKAAAALGAGKPTKERIDALIAQAYGSDLGKSWDAIDVLALTGDRRAAQALADGLTSDRMKAHATAALKKMGSIAAPFVAKHLDNNDWTIRLAAAEILVDIGTKSELSALAKARNDSNGLVKKFAEDAIAAIQAKR